MVAVYGAAQEEFKSAFLKELVNTCRDNPHPMLIGGDFNILRYQQEKTMTGLIQGGLSSLMLLSTVWI